MSQTLSPSLARCYGLARVARGVEDLRAPASIALSRRRRRTRAPVALVRLAHVRRWQTTSASTSPPPAFTARATASYGRDCASRGFAQVPGVCDG